MILFVFEAKKLTEIVSVWQLRSCEAELAKSQRKVHKLDVKLARQRRINRQLRYAEQKRDDADQSAAAAVAAAAAAHLNNLTSQVHYYCCLDVNSNWLINASLTVATATKPF